MTFQKITDNHFIGLSVAIVTAIVLFYQLALPTEWAHSSNAQRLIDWVSNYYPGLSRMKNQWNDYTPEIGILFSLMWMTSPLHLILGAASAFFSPDSRQKQFNRAHWTIPLALVTFLSAAVIDSFVYPYIGLGLKPLFPINQASKNLIDLILSWSIISITIFTIGQFLCRAIIKLVENSQIKKVDKR